MKHLSFITLAFFLMIASSSVFAQKHRGPEITFEETKFSFDTLTSQDTAVHYFRFTNTGDEPLIISTTFSSCGCTVPTWPKYPIMPGQSDVVKIGFHTQNLGYFNKAAVVKSNAINTPSTLRINGFVKEKEQQKKTQNIDSQS